MKATHNDFRQMIVLCSLIEVDRLDNGRPEFDRLVAACGE
jgi:hypothetical protein